MIAPIGGTSRNETGRLLKSCPDSGKKRQEQSGYFKGCDADGMPLDDAHWWKK
jgi:hypothetical protein